MPINAVCPDCENRFQLQESLLGQSMRCPFCKTVFVVTAHSSKLTFEAPPAEAPPDVGTQARPRTDTPSTNYRSGSIGDFVKIVEGSSAKPAPTERKWSPDLDPSKSDSKKTTVGGPKEITWTPDFDPTSKATTASEDDPADQEPLLPRERSVKPVRKSRRVALLALVAFVFVGLAAGGFFLKRYLDFAPERLYAAGKKEYDETHFDQSRKLFDQLIKDYPDHPRTVEARFFGPLAGLRNSVSSVMNKTDPTGSVSLWDQFQTTIGDPPLAPFAEKNRFGVDIWQTGNRLMEDILSKGNEVFNRDDPSDSDKWLQEALRIGGMLDRFRPDDVGRPEGLTKDLATLRAKIEGSRERAGVLKEIRGLLAEPDDDKLQSARQVAIARGMEKDEGYLKIAGEAEQKIRSKAIYIPINPVVKPSPITDDGLASLLFAPRLDRGPRAPVRGTPTTFFALARGILYALDEADGRVLWAMRTGIDSHIPATRVPDTDATPELAVVPTVDGNQAGIHARHFRNGLSMWYQPLPAPCASQPVVVGADLYVPLADPQGTILEIVAATGELKGKIQLGRPLGGPLALRPGTTQLFIPAESAGVYAFDVDRRGANSEHLDPALAGVVTTGHGPGTLQGTPFFANPEPDNPGPRNLIVCVANGLERMVLRACPFTDAESGGIDGAGSPAEIVVPGWSRFPIYCDGEKIALVTDQRDLLLLGLGLTGNRDVSLFPLPGNDPASPSQSDSLAQLVMADEVNYWVLSGKQLRQYRSGFTGRDGVRLIPVTKGISVGEPVHAAQLNARRDMMVVFTHEGSSHFATAVDAVTGQMVWQRELGLQVRGEPFRKGNDLLWLDQGGGMTRLDVSQLTEDRKPVWLADVNDRWLIAAPVTGFRLLTGLIDAPGDVSLALLESESGPRRFLLRLFDGNRVSEQLLPTPAGLAGSPLVGGRLLVLPLDNGTLQRVVISEGKALEEGPSWRGSQLSATAVCHLGGLDGENFLATDGGKSIVRWFWADGNKRFESRGRLTLRDPLRQKLFVIPGPPNRLILVDNAGNLVLRDADQLDKPPIRVWRSAGKDPVVPANERIVSVTPPPGGLAANAVVLGSQSAFSLKFDEEKPVWKSPVFSRPLAGITREAGGTVLITDQVGEIRRLNLKTGEISGLVFRVAGSVAVAGGALALDEKHLLIPLTDGTLLLGEADRKPAPLAPGKP